MNKYLIDRYQQVISPVIGHFTNLAIVKGEGCYLIDHRQKRYLDFTCGIGVTSTGHCHPKVIDAITNQASQLMHCSIGMGYYEGPVSLSERLNTYLPDSYMAYFCQSGAEAVEAALKLALYAQNRSQIISHTGGFHGRTMGALSVTFKHKYRERYDALLGQTVSFLPYPDPYRESWASPETTEQDYYTRLKSSHLFNDQVAAVIIECVLGEGGYIPAPVAYLNALSRICKENGIILIADEIQSGIGRTGQWFAFEHAGLSPDIITLAKGLGSGVPIGACLGKKAIMNKWDTSHHGSTYGGNPLVCAAANATLSVIEPCLDHVGQLGLKALDYLNHQLYEHPYVGQIRGRGLMIGIELVKNKQSKQPHPELVKKIRDACLSEGLLIIFCGEQGHVIRLIPPLIISNDELFHGLDILISALNAHS